MDLINIQLTSQETVDTSISIEAIERVLEVGRILFSVLTEDEIKSLAEMISRKEQIGNAGGS